MRTPRHKVGIDLAVSFDDEKKCLIVSHYKRPIPNFHGDWEDVATFDTEAAWYKSEFQSMIVGDDNVAMIAFFWHDMAKSSSA